MGISAVPASAISFPDGVASGDVTSSRAILWTRIDAPTTEQIRVDGWTNPDLSGPRAIKGKMKTVLGRDLTVKIDATGLTPNTRYYYVFRSGDENDPGISDVGTFKTAPAAGDGQDVNLAYTGDADGTKVNGVPAVNNFETLDGVRAENADAWIFDGDTIYADSRHRTSPATTLAEYRAAHKENRSYPALRNLMEATSTYATMDDHEVKNDYDATVNTAQYAAGRKAFLENYPIRETGLPHDTSCAGDPLYRKFQWGSDAEVFLLDERSCRSPEVAANPCLGDLGPTLPTSLRTSFPFFLFLTPTPPPGCLAAINNPTRTLLGPVQKAQLKQDLINSTAKYKLVVSQDPIQQFHVLPYDRWEGYGAERSEILNYISNNGIDNVEFLTTDTHATLQNEVFLDRFTAPATIAHELVTGPVATDTFQTEVINVGGNLGLIATNAILNVDGINCRDLNRNSYATVNVSDSAGTATLTSKDQNGVPITNTAAPNQPCTETHGP